MRKQTSTGRHVAYARMAVAATSLCSTSLEHSSVAHGTAKDYEEPDMVLCLLTMANLYLRACGMLRIWCEDLVGDWVSREEFISLIISPSS